jgi:acyl transferase domain-containing protein/NADPH:quinone reductase-like Zn-dependent oxidoreductase/NAD(P)-dependent dehydrogenase (short-subunit alcohol dehydrogenase family)/acyl carrier protein/SAM-dependent methyltransferase
MSIAIIGVSCRFPGASHFLQVPALMESRHTRVRESAPARWRRRTWRELENPEHREACRWAGLLDQIDHFDALFFRISPREALLLDPQQRILLELAWESLEDAGYPAASLAGSRTGVFLGVCNYDYKELLDQSPRQGDGYSLTGTANTFLANRVSRLLKVNGPSTSIDTACSSSLVAVHQAMQSLAAGECSLAIAGGVNILCNPTRFLPYAGFGMLSPNGRCSPFDASANGYVRGEGAGVVLLKRLDDAVRDGDRIHAVLRGSAVNHAGESRSTTAPNPAAQSKVVADACRAAGVLPADISYVEAHGTGTPVGDPIEIHGLRKAFAMLDRESGQQRPGEPHCAIGSIKPLIGHLEGAAGIAGLIKVIEALESRRLPGIVHFTEQNPRIKLEGSPFYLLAGPRPWDVPPGRKRIAGVSSFGLGGTNAHVIVEEAPAAPVDSPADHEEWIPLSAPTAPVLARQARLLADHLRQRPLPLAEVAHTLRCGRDDFDHRALLGVRSRDELLQGLEALAAGSRLWAAPGLSVPPAPAEWLERRDNDWVRNRAAGRIVSLPSDPYTRQRYWAPQERGESGAGILVDRSDPAIREHLVHGETVVPAAAYFGWIAQAAARDTTGLSFRDVKWPAALTVPDDTPIEVQVTFADAGRFELRGPSGVVHVSGCLVETTPPRPPNTTAPVLPLQPSDALYAALRAQGLCHGPTLQGVTANGADEGVAVGTLRPSPEPQPWDTAALDAALHVAAALLLDEAAGAMPVALREFTVWADLAEARGAVARRPQLTDPYSFDILITAADDSPVAALTGLTVRPLASESFLFRRTWKPTETPVADGYTELRIDPAADPETALLQLGHTLGSFPGDRLLLVAPGGFGVHPDDAVSPMSAAAVAMAQCLAKERPWMRVCCSDTPATAIEAAPGAAALVAVRDGKRLVPQLRRLAWPRAVGGPAGQTWLIAGGGQGLGLEAGVWLARTRSARVVVLGRRALDAALDARLHRIAAAGGDFRYVQADLTDPASVRDAVAQAQQAFGPIHGAIHSALDLRDAPLDALVDTDFRAVFRTKYQGVQSLANALADQPLQSFVIFSSAVAVSGNAGQASYAAACAAQDAVAAQLGREHNFPVHTIHWGYWGETGAVEGRDAHLARVGVKPIGTREGLQAFGAILGAGLPAVVALRAEPELLAELGFAADVRERVLPALHPPLVPGLWAGVNPPHDANAFARETDGLATLQAWARGRVGAALQTVAASGGALARHQRLAAQLAAFAGPPADGPAPSVAGLEPHTRLLTVCLDGMADVLLGRRAATEVVLSPSAFADVAAVYQGCALSAWYNRAAGELVRRIPGERLRIVEVGAGTGATTAAVLEALGERPVDYLATDVSRQFAGVVKRFPWVRFVILDAERHPAEQGFAPGQADVVIAANVVHATKRIAETLAHLKWLLRRNGVLVLSELCQPDFFTLLTFGLLDGWWRFDDAESRLPNSPLLGPAEWSRALTRAGFRPFGLEAPSAAGQFLRQYVAAAASDGVVVDPQPTVAPAATPVPVAPTAPPALDFEACIAGHLSRATGIPAADLDPDRTFADYGVDSLVALDLLKGLSTELGRPVRPNAIFDYPAIRTLARHLAETAPPAAKPVAPTPPPTVPQLSHRAPWSVESAWGVSLAARSALSDVAVAPVGVGDPAPGEIQVLPKAFGLNFGDLLCVTGLYPTMPEYPFIPGFEVAGIVSKVGRGVSRFAIGDAVLALTGARLGGHASAVNLPADFAIAKPEALAFPTAAALPVAYLTAEAALERAQLARGERVLIQSAAGGVGMMALRLAAERGAEVWATAGTDERCARLQAAGAHHVINYRTTDFAAEIRRLTQGEGVDVVINMLPPDAIQAGLDLLTPGGRYIELAVAGLQAAGPLRLGGLADNRTFCAIDMRRAALRRPETVRAALERMAARLRGPGFAVEGPQVFALEEVGEAYRALESRRVTGKVVVEVPESAWPAQRIRLQPEQQPEQRIAIIGLSGRFAGAPDVDAFWQALATGADLVQGMPDNRRRLVRGPDWPGAFLDDIDCFDPLFFNISGKEAEFMDPQQRLFLEECWRTVESAGLPAAALSGTRTGIYLGGGTGDYLDALADAGVPLEAGAFTGNEASICAARAAYFLNLKGPAVAISTACSSSLVAIDEACKALRSGECEMALAGGVFVMTTRRFHEHCTRAGMLSPRGKCHTFDESADGFAPGEAVGVLLLKPLARALADGDPIRGIILASGVNQDGRTNGITAPSTASQTELVRSVLAKAQVPAASITLMECHGTGTKLGDPVELEALTAAYAEAPRGVCVASAVKTNLGHTVTAAGVTGVIKAVLAMEHAQIPPSLHLRQPNHRIPFAETPFRLATELEPWNPSGPRRAAVSSFGFSGTNAHLILEQAPAAPRPSPQPGSCVFCLSAESEGTLARRADDLLRWLRTTGEYARPGDVALTLYAGRTSFRFRLAIVAKDLPELAVRLAHRQEGCFTGVGAKTGPNDHLDTADLALWASRWVNGFAGGPAPWVQPDDRRIPLPTYPFERERYWAAPAAEPHTRLTASSPWFQQHRVGGAPVLPGAALLELARQHSGLGHQGTLRNVVWKSAVREVDSLGFVTPAGRVQATTSAGVALDAELAPELSLGRLDWEAKARQLSRSMTGEACRAELRRRGIEHGPAFHALRDLCFGEGCAVAQLAIAAASPEAVLQPGLLDAAWQVAVTLIGEDGLWVPASMTEVAWSAALPAECVAVVERSGAPGVFTVTLCRPNGEIVARCLELRLAPVLLRSAQIWQPEWHPAPLPAVPPATPERIVVALDSNYLPAVARQFPGSRVTVEPMDALATCSAELILVPVNAEPGVELFDLARALVQRTVPTRVLWLASASHASSIAALAGTLRQENPRLAPQVLIAANDTDWAAEWTAPSPWASAVEYRNGQRLARTLSLAPAAPAPASPLRRGGAYLITGGFGSLGRHLAEALTSRWDAAVTLLGRGPASPSHADWLQSQQAQGRRMQAATSLSAGPFHGVFHLAATLDDGLLSTTTNARIAAVLQSKLATAQALDAAIGDAPLDFFVLFSSLAAWAGNAGQAAYAYANGALDDFGRWREAERHAGRRNGPTLSINWPLWEQSAMGTAAAQEQAARVAGLRPMPVAVGLEALFALLGHPGQRLVTYGEPAALEAFLRSAELVSSVVATPASTSDADAEALLRQLLADALRLPASRLHKDTPFERFGIDSISAVAVVNALETTFGPLPKTLLFECTTMGELLAYFRVHHAPALARAAGADIPVPTPAPLPTSPTTPHHEEGIAIIGLAGRFPDADDLDAFWANLLAGRDSIREVPADRWDHEQYYDADKNRSGATYGRWGGFLDDVTSFDPLFFRISPREANRIDPQERLFLECAWHAMEDAGYTPETLQTALGGRVGVYAGVMWSDYQLWAPESLRQSGVIPSSSFASIANRVSWTLNLNGPSLAVDTMCSSSLTGMHLACQSLLLGECNAALVGGVNLQVHPQKYLYLAQEKFLSTDGRCRSFGEGGDGYVPGEGAGVILLRRLSDALAAGDRILGVIRATGVAHGGHTHGYTVPSPKGQSELIASVLAGSGVDAATIGYIEAHGTGTSLGDPIEIRALEQAFAGQVPTGWQCTIGSVKANIGHLESAAGIAAVAKVLLQFRAGQIAPSIHSERLNPRIAFATSPFRVAQAATPWPSRGGAPRRAAISSFGAGGANAHVILEAPAPPASPRPTGDGPQLFVFSAMAPDRLEEVARRWVRFLDHEGAHEQLADLAWTLQTGRVALAHRLAIPASSHAELRGKLADFLRGDARSSGIFHGHVDDTMAELADNAEAASLVSSLEEHGELDKLARLWVLTPMRVDWRLLHGAAAPRRVGVPQYPFARERCWVTAEDELRTLLQKLRKGECGVEEAIAAMERNHGN